MNEQSDQTLEPPEADLENGSIDEKRDGVTYKGPYWTVWFDETDSGEYEFNTAEFEQPLTELPDRIAEKIRGVSRGYGGTWDGEVSTLGGVPDAIVKLVASDYPLEGQNGTEKSNTEPESWLYDGRCPDCGSAVCIELRGQADLCYTCGRRVEHESTGTGEETRAYCPTSAEWYGPHPEASFDVTCCPYCAGDATDGDHRIDAEIGEVFCEQSTQSTWRHCPNCGDELGGTDE